MGETWWNGPLYTRYNKGHRQSIKWYIIIVYYSNTYTSVKIKLWIRCKKIYSQYVEEFSL
jgi:hypothetical protein